MKSLYVVVMYVLILCPIEISASLLACSFGYDAGLYIINFPMAGLILISTIVVEMDTVFMRKFLEQVESLPENMARQIKLP